MLLLLDAEAAVTKCLTLPSDFPDQVRYGFEGVAQDGDYVVIAVQREWGDEEHPRIAVYNQATDEWKYAFYPLDDVESQYGGWVGLSDIAPVGDGNFLVLERDSQGGPDAAVKRIYQINLGDYSFDDGFVVSKESVKDLIEDLESGNGSVIEKIEGLAVTSAGDIWINSDNDGVDDNSGEQILMKVGEFSSLDVANDVPIIDIVNELNGTDDKTEVDGEGEGAEELSSSAYIVGACFFTYFSMTAAALL
jgi:hypothetical protein